LEHASESTLWLHLARSSTVVSRVFSTSSNDGIAGFYSPQADNLVNNERWDSIQQLHCVFHFQCAPTCRQNNTSCSWIQMAVFPLTI